MRYPPPSPSRTSPTPPGHHAPCVKTTVNGDGGRMGPAARNDLAQTNSDSDGKNALPPGDAPPPSLAPPPAGRSPEACGGQTSCHNACDPADPAGLTSRQTPERARGAGALSVHTRRRASWIRTAHGVAGVPI